MGSAAAFDPVAGGYDASFTSTALGRLLRARVWSCLERCFAPGGTVLDLGCGTGEDAVWLARRGVRVVATDVSAAMLEETRAKVAREGVGGLVEVRSLDLDAIAETPAPEGAPFDGALADFGVLNCLADRRRFAAALAGWLRPGACLVAVVMGRFCAWEIGWHLVRLRPRAAFRRLRGAAEVRLAGGRSVAVSYPTPGGLRRELAPHFRPLRELGIGVLLPPPYLSQLADRRPGLVARLARLEQVCAHRWPAPWLGDHFLAVLARSGQAPGPPASASTDHGSTAQPPRASTL